MSAKINKYDTLESKLKKSDPYIKSYVVNLRKCIRKLESENARLRVKDTELSEKIKAMTIEIKKATKKNSVIKIIRDNI